jgi:hypothetical protein
MGLDLDRIRKRQAEGRQGRFWRPTSGGKNHIRAFKFSHVVTEADVKAGFFPKEKLGKKIEDFDRPVKLVFGIGEDKKPVLATKEHQDRYEKLAASNKTSDQSLAEKVKPKISGLLNIVDTDARPFRLQVWKAPPGVVSDLFAKVCDEDYGEAILGPDGRDFTIKFDKSKPPAKMYSIEIRDQDKSPKLPAELAEKAVDFYGKSLEAILGLEPKAEEEEEEAEEKDEEEKPAEDSVAKPAAKSSKSDDDDEEEEDEDNDD